MNSTPFRQVLEDLSWDIKRYSYRMGISGAKVVLLSPGFQAVMVYRFGHWLMPLKSKNSILSPLIVILMELSRIVTEIITGIEIDFRAEIGAGLVMLHRGGVVIGPLKIGRNCEIFQGVTLGVKNSLDDSVATIGDRVYLAPGAKVLGDMELGNDVLVGPNTVVVNSVPDRGVVLGVPGRIVGKTGSFDYVVYPGMENDPERQKSLAMLIEARLEQDKNLPQVAYQNGSGVTEGAS
jgi:serine O-acetyltransferase